jgi:hypothetical protein
MKIDYERIRLAFPGKAWAYAELYNSVRIGRWDGNALMFYQPITPSEEEFLLELRIFNTWHELKFTGVKCRDTGDYDAGNFVTELADHQYYMYGERNTWRNREQGIDGYTPLWEDRGGTVYFPAVLNFPKDAAGHDMVSLKLGVKNFVRYHTIPVLPGDAPYNQGLSMSGVSGLEVIDYAYTGFAYADGKEVTL